MKVFVSALLLLVFSIQNAFCKSLENGTSLSDWETDKLANHGEAEVMMRQRTGFKDIFSVYTAYNV